MPIRLPAICDYHQTRSPLEKGLLAGIISHGLSCRCDELCLFEALHPAPLARPFSKGLLAGIISHGLLYRCGELCLFEALHPAPLARPFSKGLLEGGLSHMGFYTAAASCASSRHSILRLWRGPSPRAYSRGIISHGLLYRCGELCLFEALYPAPLARPFSKGLLAGGIF